MQLFLVSCTLSQRWSLPHLCLLHHVGSIQAHGRGHAGKVACDGVHITELDRTAKEHTVHRHTLENQYRLGGTIMKAKTVALGNVSRYNVQGRYAV